MGGDTPCICFSLHALEDSQRQQMEASSISPSSFPGIVSFPSVASPWMGGPCCPLRVWDEGGSAEYTPGGYEETLMPCFFPKSIPITDPSLRGKVEGPCCDTPTNGTERGLEGSVLGRDKCALGLCGGQPGRLRDVPFPLHPQLIRLLLALRELSHHGT